MPPQKGRLTNKHPFSAQRALLKHVFKRFKICLKNKTNYRRNNTRSKACDDLFKGGAHNKSNSNINKAAFHCEFFEFFKDNKYRFELIGAKSSQKSINGKTLIQQGDA